MKKFLLTLAVLCLATASFAQGPSFGSGLITATAAIGACQPGNPNPACVILQLSNVTSGSVVTISGTFSATLQFEVSPDGGTTWLPLGAVPQAGGAVTTSTTTAGTWLANVSPMTYVRVRASAYASGTASVVFSVSNGTNLPTTLAARVDAGAPFSCSITLSSNTVTQCQAAPAAGLRNYVTNYQFVTTAAGTTTTVGLDYGTAANCGTGTTALTPVYPNTTAVPANSNGVLVNFSGSGLVPPTANAICGAQAGTTAGTTVVIVTGFVAP